MNTLVNTLVNTLYYGEYSCRDLRRDNIEGLPSSQYHTTLKIYHDLWLASKKHENPVQKTKLGAQMPPVKHQNFSKDPPETSQRHPTLLRTLMNTACEDSSKYYGE